MQNEHANQDYHTRWLRGFIAQMQDPRYTDKSVHKKEMISRELSIVIYRR